MVVQSIPPALVPGRTYIYVSIGGLSSGRGNVDNWGAIPSVMMPLVDTLIAEDIDVVDNDIGIDYYVGLVRHVLHGHEFEQDVPS